MTREDEAAHLLKESVRYLDMVRARTVGKPGELIGAWECGCRIVKARKWPPEQARKYTEVVPCQAHVPCLIQKEYEKQSKVKRLAPSRRYA